MQNFLVIGMLSRDAHDFPTARRITPKHRLSGYIISEVRIIIVNVVAIEDECNHLDSRSHGRANNSRHGSKVDRDRKQNGLKQHVQCWVHDQAGPSMDGTLGALELAECLDHVLS